MAGDAEVVPHGDPGVVERLGEVLTGQATGADPATLETFARLLLQRGQSYVGALPTRDLAALVGSAYRFYAGPGPAVRARAISPAFATDGWDANVSVVETAMPDRPFIVDTVRGEIEAAGVEIEALLHPLFGARRDLTGALERLSPPDGEAVRESFVHVAIRRTADRELLARLAAGVRARLDDVRVVTDDFQAMLARAHGLAAELEAVAATGPSRDAAQASAGAEFLRWLADGAFVFLGYREYEVMMLGGERVLLVRSGSGLGLLRAESRSAFARPRALTDLPEPVHGRLLGERLVTIAKTTAVSPVHRRARMDDIGVRRIDADGRVVGERRFIGLFTSKAYAEEAAEIPYLRRMLREVLAAEQALPGSYDHKAIVSIFNALPKDELFAATAAEVRTDVRTALAAIGTDDVEVSVRHGGRGTSALVVLPAKRVSTETRTRIRELVAGRVGTPCVAEYVAGDEDRTLLSFAFAEGGAALAADATAALRTDIARAVRSWEERLADALVARAGEPEGRRRAARYRAAFPADYRVATSPEQAADDVALLESALAARVMRAALLPAGAVPDTTALRVYLPGTPLALSDVVPLLENFGLRALAEEQVVVTPRDAGRVFIRTLSVQDRNGRALDVPAVGPRLLDAISAVRDRRVADDVLNRLVLEGGLDWRAVDCLRTYAGHGVQAGLGTRAVVLGVLAAHPGPAGHLFACFAARFAPSGEAADGRAARPRFIESLETVTALRDDVILRALLDTVEATVRTNYFAPGGQERVAIKIRSRELAHLPRPRPLYEVYVHAPRVEALHLRAGRIARGGIRWSDRPEDFRTEILGLMKTQTVKNAVIVPVGAKGGFVPTGETAPDDVAAAYDTFMRALLDVTDDRVGGQVVHPPCVVVHDEDDPYLVVAADKGTARFSDRANAIALERGFWLGDAFASGGSHGYDHKALGITACGAWESVRTHFREIGVVADTAPLTVAGIGDPSGDVFGNGLLRSQHLRLRAAFDHRHVFLDPDPDPAVSFAERERLFRAVAGWEAYDPAQLSRGGAVLPRAAKRVVLSPEAQDMLGLPGPETSGERLVQAVLTLDVDLLFNGGIGTYVKAPSESDGDVGDPANDRVRVDAGAVRARVVAEGGNLGFTQRARVAYALAGGRINTDAIDNSAGVDLSDHEVNLKICLAPVVASGALAPEARNDLLQSVGVVVVARVLDHNRRQSRLLGLDQLRSRTRLADFVDLQAELERAAGLDRGLEALPDREALRGRRGTFLGLTRPELAVLTAYTKLHLQHEILASGLPDDPLVEPYLVAYFPPAVGARWPDAIHAHPLRREIVATELANALVDHVGITFVARLARDTGAGTADVVRAWSIGWRLAGGDALVAAVTAGGPALDVESTCQLALEATAERVSKWIIANVDPGRPATAVVADVEPAVASLRALLPEWLAGSEAETFHKRVSEFRLAGLAAPLAHELATAEWLTGPLDVVTVAREAGVDPAAAGAVYYALGQHIDFAWLVARLAESGTDDRWERRAAEGLVADLLRARRRLARRRLRDPLGALPERPLAAVQSLLRDLRAAPRVTLAALQVIVHEIRRLTEEVQDR